MKAPIYKYISEVHARAEEADEPYTYICNEICGYFKKLVIDGVKLIKRPLAIDCVNKGKEMEETERLEIQ